MSHISILTFTKHLLCVRPLVLYIIKMMAKIIVFLTTYYGLASCALTHKNFRPILVEAFLIMMTMTLTIIVLILMALFRGPALWQILC